MTTYAVTGSTGHLGRLVVQELLARGVPATDVLALARTPEKAAALGVPVRPVDYSDPATLPEALAGVDVLLLVSGSEVGKRLPQHTAVIEAAKAAGVQRVAYTSIANAEHSANPLTPEHKATEDVLRASGLPFTILRDNWYLENYTAQLPQYLATGEVLGINGDARIGAATRADMAVAAATAVSLGGILLLVFAWMGIRAAVLATNCSAWEREWRLVEPRWSGRGTAAP